MATIGFNIYEFGKASKLLKLMLAEPELYTDFSYLTYWSKIFQQCAGLAIFMGFVKIFKYISFNSTMATLAGTLKQVITKKNSINTAMYIKVLEFYNFISIPMRIYCRVFQNSEYLDLCTFWSLCPLPSLLI